jgi:hypothetical protein
MTDKQRRAMFARRANAGTPVPAGRRAVQQPPGPVRAAGLVTPPQSNLPKPEPIRMTLDRSIRYGRSLMQFLPRAVAAAQGAPSIPPPNMRDDAIGGGGGRVRIDDEGMTVPRNPPNMRDDAIRLPGGPSGTVKPSTPAPPQRPTPPDTGVYIGGSRWFDERTGKYTTTDGLPPKPDGSNLPPPAADPKLQSPGGSRRFDERTGRYLNPWEDSGDARPMPDLRQFARRR